MKQYIVSLNIVTPNLVSEKEIAIILKKNSSNIEGRDLSSGSVKLWRIESMLDDSEPLVSQIESIVSIISLEKLMNCKHLIENIYFDIGVLCDAYTCTIEFSSDALKAVTNLNSEIGLSITYYPSDVE